LHSVTKVSLAEFKQFSYFQTPTKESVSWRAASYTAPSNFSEASPGKVSAFNRYAG
jgi:hypothetical protein